MATFTNRSRLFVAVKRHPALKREFPFDRVEPLATGRHWLDVPRDAAWVF